MTVGPASAPQWVRRAVADGGGVLVEPEDATGLIWFSGSPAGLDDYLRRAPELRWVQLATAGVENFRTLLRSNHVWSCAKGIYGDAVGEHALALILCAFRRVAHFARQSEWSRADGRNLHGSRVTIVGGGGIASSLIRMLAPFETRNTVVRRSPVAMPGVHRVAGTSELHPVLTDSDVVVLALPLTDDTVCVIGRTELELMGPDAWLVNVARGQHVDTEALTEVLRLGRIGGAALDVTDPEPLPPGHPLWTLDSAIVTPHTANTPGMMERSFAALLRSNVAAHIDGLPVQGIVDSELAY